MKTHRQFRRPAEEAFSLVEIMVSVAILGILMTMLFAFFNQATTAWQSTEKKMSAFREARAAFYYIKRDLNNMVVSSSVKWSFYENTANFVSGSDLPPAPNGDAILFLTSIPPEGQDQNANKSDLCLVGYYLAYRQTSSASPKKSYNLYRYFRSSDTTWTAPGQSMTGGNPITQGLLAFIRAGSGDLNTLLYSPPGAADGVLAHNVINFEIKAYDDQLQPLSGLNTLNTAKPDIIEVSMTVFNQETAQKFTTPADWYYEEAASTALQAANAHTFHLRVPVK